MLVEMKTEDDVFGRTISSAAARSESRGLASSYTLLALEPGCRRRQETRQALRIVPLPVRLDDEVLADLDLDIRQAAPLAMDRNAVVGLVADPIGLIVAD